MSAKISCPHSSAIAFGVFDEHSRLQRPPPSAASCMIFTTDQNSLPLRRRGLERSFRFQRPISFALNAFLLALQKWARASANAATISRAPCKFLHCTSLPSRPTASPSNPDEGCYAFRSVACTFRDHPNDLTIMEWMKDRALEILDSPAQNQVAPPSQEAAVRCAPARHLPHGQRWSKTSVINADLATHYVRIFFSVDRKQPRHLPAAASPTMTSRRWPIRAGRRITIALPARPKFPRNPGERLAPIGSLLVATRSCPFHA